MKKTSLIIATLALIVMGGLLNPREAHAEELLFEYDETFASTTISGTTLYGMRFFGINPPNWVVERVGIWVTGFSGAGASATWNLTIRNAANTVVATSSAKVLAVGWNYFDISPQLLSGFGNDMRIQVTRFTGTGGLNSRGTNIVTAAPTDEYRLHHSSGTPDEYPIMRIYGIDADDPAAGTTTSRILSQISPALGATTPDNIVTFEFDYYNNDTEETPVTIAGVEIRDLTAAFQYAPLESDIITSGQATFEKVENLAENHFHIWRPYLRDEDGTRYVYGTWYSFDVVGASAPFQLGFDPETGEPLTATSTSFLDFLNVPELLKTKAPTGYIYQMGALLANLDDIAATSTPSLSVSFVSASSSLTSLQNVELFSYSTVTSLIPTWILTLMRALMVAILYIGALMHIIRHSHNMFGA